MKSNLIPSVKKTTDKKTEGADSLPTYSESIHALLMKVQTVAEWNYVYEQLNEYEKMHAFYDYKIATKIAASISSIDEYKSVHSTFAEQDDLIKSIGLERIAKMIKYDSDLSHFLIFTFNNSSKRELLKTLGIDRIRELVISSMTFGDILKCFEYDTDRNTFLLSFGLEQTKKLIEKSKNIGPVIWPFEQSSREEVLKTLGGIDFAKQCLRCGVELKLFLDLFLNDLQQVLLEALCPDFLRNIMNVYSDLNFFNQGILSSYASNPNTKATLLKMLGIEYVQSLLIDTLKPLPSDRRERLLDSFGMESVKDLTRDPDYLRQILSLCPGIAKKLFLTGSRSSSPVFRKVSGTPYTESTTNEPLVSKAKKLAS